MRFPRFLPLAAVLALAAAVPAVGADVKAERQALRQKLKQEAKEAAAKAEEAKKAADAKKAEDAKKADDAKQQAAAKAADAKRAKAQAGGSLDPTAVAALIDERVDAKLVEAKIEPSTPCTDAEFLRRAYLDVTGVIPPAEKVLAFLDDRAPDKRAKLVDALLADPNYGRRNADVWTPKLYAKDSGNKFITPGPFHDWIKDQFNADTPWDKFVTSVVTASGTVDEHPEVTFFLANRTIDKLTDATTQHFLGVRLGCAQCHNHPFTPTKQAEYWGMAAFYSKVKADKPNNPKKGGDNDTLGVHENNQPNKQKDFFPESAKKVPAKFFGGAEPKLDAKEPYRPALARWMTSQENPYFARAMVNRVWAQYFGNGIVDPVDDMIETRKPSHPELLAELSERFVAGGFDVKQLVRGICASRAYQRTAKPTDANKDDSQLFSHMAVKVLSPEMLFDSMAQLVGTDKAAGRPAEKGNANPKKGPTDERSRFVQFFLAGTDEPNSTEYEAGIPQALRIMNAKNGPVVASAKKLTAGLKPDAAVDKLYLAALARRPTSEEKAKLTAYIAKNPADAYGDILWAVVNSSEFEMNR